MFTPMFLTLWALMLVAQNWSFTFVSRARNSASLSRHFKAALLSNALYMLNFLFTFSIADAVKGRYGLVYAAFIIAFYSVFTVTGSIVAHYYSLKTERGKSVVGANARYAQIPIEQWEEMKTYVDDLRKPKQSIPIFIPELPDVELPEFRSSAFPSSLINEWPEVTKGLVDRNVYHKQESTKPYCPVLHAEPAPPIGTSSPYLGVSSKDIKRGEGGTSA